MGTDDSGKTKPLRVAIVGAGAAGSAAAWSLGRHGSKFEVDVWEAGPQAGGVATTETLPNGVVINDGVQGGAMSYRNTINLLDTLGVSVTDTPLTLAFGKGDQYWSNVEVTPFARAMEPQVRRFGRVLKFVSYLEPIFVFISISVLLKICCFSKEFVNGMVYPLAALFFATGNQTPNVSSVMVSRVFFDPKLRLFDYDPKTLLSQTPKMFVFPPLSDIYDKVSKACGRGVTFHFNSPIVAVLRDKDGVTLRDHGGHGHRYDKVIFACDAETAIKLHGGRRNTDAMGYFERTTLDSVKYFTEITVTHADEAYLTREYEMDTPAGKKDSTKMKSCEKEHSLTNVTLLEADEEDVVAKSNASQPSSDSCALSFSDPPSEGSPRSLEDKSEDEAISPPGSVVHDATDHPSKMYFIRVNPNNPEQLEMSFDLTTYQPHARTAEGKKVFQSIFLDTTTSHDWTIEDIDESQVLLRKWSRQFGHGWRHYVGVVPWFRFFQGDRHTLYCGSWTLLNTHEIAIISGLAAAHRLGAEYPFPDDELAVSQFQMYLSMIHGKSYKPPKTASFTNV